LISIGAALGGILGFFALATLLICLITKKPWRKHESDAKTKSNQDNGVVHLNTAVSAPVAPDEAKHLEETSHHDDHVQLEDHIWIQRRDLALGVRLLRSSDVFWKWATEMIIISVKCKLYAAGYNRIITYQAKGGERGD
jgi:2-succinyl-5-enolpyruvyl-6-hydroxy-3-cyclohexene-1-carboxylate synthase